MLLWEKKIYFMLIKQQVKAGITTAKEAQMIEIQARIDNLTDEMKGIIGETTAAKRSRIVIFGKIKGLEETLSMLASS